MKRLKLDFLRLLPLVSFLGIWEFIISPIGNNLFLYSKPSKVIESLIENCMNKILLDDFLVTGYETIVGFILGSTFGIVLGFLLWYSKRVAFIAKPYVIAIGSIPIFALAPMTIIWFGTGLQAKIIMAALSTFTVALLQAYNGANNVDDQQINLMKTFGASRYTIFKKIIFPSSLIWVLSSLKLNIGFALLGAFIGEFISADQGLGFRMIKAASLYNTSLLLAALICLLLLAFILNGLVSQIERRMIYWR